MSTGNGSVYVYTFRHSTGPILFHGYVTVTDTPKEVQKQLDPLGGCSRRQRLAKESLRMLAPGLPSPVSPGELGDAVGTWRTHTNPRTMQRSPVYILESH